jgi:hypothetical protein
VKEGVAMPAPGNVVFWVSLVGLFILTILSFRKTRNFTRTIIFLAFLVVCGAAYYLIFQTGDRIHAKGAQPNELSFIIILYVCMLLGIVCHYFYGLLMKPKGERQRFDVGVLLAPVFASPIVFVPLLAAFQEAEIDLANLTIPKFMVFFVAFQNGFFWKEVVENHRKEIAK